MFIDLCDDDDDSSFQKMPPPPPSSLKNITNIANQFSPFEDLTDTPVSTNDKLKAAWTPDELTDTPIHQSRNLSVRHRLSDGLTDTPIKTAEKVKGPKKMVGRKRLRAAAGDKENRQAKNPIAEDRQERVKKRIEEKYRCRFLDTEAALDGSGEDSDEEDAIKQIEEDESNSSFINDSSQLGYTQDDLDQLNADEVVREVNVNPDDSLLHRQLNHQRSVEEQFKTPVFNRRMMRQSLSQNAPLSQRGLGNMNFIKSVLEHHRQGGDSNDIEDEYHRLAGSNSLNESQIESPSSDADDSPVRPSPQQANFQTAAAIPHASNRSNTAAAPIAKPTHQPMTLTAEQKAMIEAKRAAALKRRQQHMQQQQTVMRANPYAK
jgi:hypothetical protein